MLVIPVMDLMRGQVVRGVAGRRSEYRPIQSCLCADASPESVGRALADAGFRTVYVADLDAIGGAAPSWAVYDQWMRLGLDLWIDAGLSSVDAARELANYRASGCGLGAVVAGLETLRDFQMLCEMRAAVGAERLIFSLDMKAQTPLVGSTAWSELIPLQIGTLALRAGVRRMIVLDLARVGMGQGVGSERLCRQLACLDSQLQIIAGGGVRSLADLHSLAAAGCDAALVASALHDGRLSADECVRTRKHIRGTGRRTLINTNSH